MKRLILTALITLSLAASAAAQEQNKPAAPQPADPHAGHDMSAHAKAEEPSAAAKWFTDVELVDQDGRKVRFYSDVLKGKTVVVNAFFTTCTSVCPPMNRNMEKIQEAFGDRVGKDVFLISISVDPVTDTPERLKAWGEKFKAAPGWTLLTGEKAHVDELLRALAASTARPEDHSPITIIGNDEHGQWTRAYGLARPSQLVKLIDDAAAGRLDAAGAQSARE